MRECEAVSDAVCVSWEWGEELACYHSGVCCLHSLLCFTILFAPHADVPCFDDDDGGGGRGLHFKKKTNGRAFGDGVYFAKDGAVSVSQYASPSTSMNWKNAENGIVKVMALCESESLSFHMCWGSF